MNILPDDILAERERCAKICEDEATYYDSHIRFSNEGKALRSAAKQIRNVPTTSFNPAEGSKATADQMAAVMLLHGNERQKREALGHTEPSARDALQAIANLPTGKSEDVMAGHEDAYRAVEKLFSAPPHISVAAPTSIAERLRSEMLALNSLEPKTAPASAPEPAGKRNQLLQVMAAAIDNTRDRAVEDLLLKLNGLVAKNEIAFRAALSDFAARFADHHNITSDKG